MTYETYNGLGFLIPRRLDQAHITEFGISTLRDEKYESGQTLGVLHYQTTRSLTKQQES